MRRISRGNTIAAARIGELVMSRICGCSLACLIAASAFVGTAVAQSATSDPTIVKIDTGTARGVAAGGVIGFKGILPDGAAGWVIER
jgi:hypothetical protein